MPVLETLREKGCRLKTIALLDPFWTGHHSSYLKLFSKTLLSLDHNVMVLCSNPSEINSWAEAICDKNQGRLHVFEIHEPKGSSCPVLRIQMALDSLLWWRFAARAIKKAQSETGCRPDLVFFPWMDSCLGRFQNHHIIDRIFPYNWSGLYFHPLHLRMKLPWSAANGGLHDYDESLRSDRCRSVAILDEGVADILQQKLPDKPVVIFPDVADATQPDLNSPIVQEVIAKARGRKIISLIGGLAKRKGMLTLLETAQRPEAKDWFFMFAGHLSEESFDANDLLMIRYIASDPPQNCYFHFDFIPHEAQFNALVKASDILFGCYENFPHSSNLLAKAAIFEKHVIVSKGFCMEERVRTFGMGECIEYGDVLQGIKAIGRLIETELQADFAGYRNLHSEERLRMVLQDVCTQYSGN